MGTGCFHPYIHCIHSYIHLIHPYIHFGSTYLNSFPISIMLALSTNNFNGFVVLATLLTVALTSPSSAAPIHHKRVTQEEMAAYSAAIPAPGEWYQSALAAQLATASATAPAVAVPTPAVQLAAVPATADESSSSVQMLSGTAAENQAAYQEGVVAATAPNPAVALSADPNVLATPVNAISTGNPFADISPPQMLSGTSAENQAAYQQGVAALGGASDWYNQQMAAASASASVAAADPAAATPAASQQLYTAPVDFSQVLHNGVAQQAEPVVSWSFPAYPQE